MGKGIKTNQQVTSLRVTIALQSATSSYGLYSGLPD
jgi:hypothetical protein